MSFVEGKERNLRELLIEEEKFAVEKFHEEDIDIQAQVPHCEAICHEGDIQRQPATTSEKLNSHSQRKCSHRRALDSLSSCRSP